MMVLYNRKHREYPVFLALLPLFLHDSKLLKLSSIFPISNPITLSPTPLRPTPNPNLSFPFRSCFHIIALYSITNNNDKFK